MIYRRTMRAMASAFALLLLAPAEPGAAQLTGPRASGGCISVARPQARVTVSGSLTLQSLPGPPNYESIATGDAEERTFIIELPDAACIDDGGDFADPSQQFMTVQVSTTQEGLMDVLRASVGRQVTVSGGGFAAHTGHHHAPLVLLADRISVH